ncbi:GNAT family N-acetyltransferase [Paenibacillus popilliae]|uniref:Histone acetyltransferase n=1 Tax=Paenibacillus popilliae ATCC 14706 TaxID=1212764 RepID=M9L8I1_PAEPP|nr:GNAT family N-acetyltransferase [Paenibacillus popilliae]GAC41502.1 histone acetyltransferase [Paenibacillus popilliae ATCC 14706]
MNIRLRRPASDDRIIRRLILEELLPHSNLIWEESQVLKGIPVRLRDGVTYVAANRRNQAVGFALVQARNNILLIDLLAVSSTSQGKGCGAALLERAERYGRKQRCLLSRVYVDQGNGVARRFYERHGYLVRRYIMQIACHEMEKPLDRR